MLKKLLRSKKGSPTLEYVIIIAAGAAFAGLLLAMFGEGEDNKGITDAMRNKIKSTVESLNEDPGDDNDDGWWW